MYHISCCKIRILVHGVRLNLYLLVGMPIKKPVTISDNRHSVVDWGYAASISLTFFSSSDKSLLSSANCTSVSLNDLSCVCYRYYPYGFHCSHEPYSDIVIVID